MSTINTSRSFAKLTITALKYVVAVAIIVVCATVSFRFGKEIFSTEGVDEAPGTDMTFTVENGTTLDQFADTLEEFNVIKSSSVFKIQTYLYDVKDIAPGTYTFNSSNSNEEIFKIISKGPIKEDKKKKKKK